MTCACGFWGEFGEAGPALDEFVPDEGFFGEFLPVADAVEPVGEGVCGGGAVAETSDKGGGQQFTVVVEPASDVLGALPNCAALRAACRPEVGGPSRSRAFSRSAVRGFAALSRCGADRRSAFPCLRAAARLGSTRFRRPAGDDAGRRPALRCRAAP